MDQKINPQKFKTVFESKTFLQKQLQSNQIMENRLKLIQNLQDKNDYLHKKFSDDQIKLVELKWFKDMHSLDLEKLRENKQRQIIQQQEKVNQIAQLAKQQQFTNQKRIQEEKEQQREFAQIQKKKLDLEVEEKRQVLQQKQQLTFKINKEFNSQGLSNKSQFWKDKWENVRKDKDLLIRQNLSLREIKCKELEEHQNRIKQSIDKLRQSNSQRASVENKIKSIKSMTPYEFVLNQSVQKNSKSQNSSVNHSFAKKDSILLDIFSPKNIQYSQLRAPKNILNQQSKDESQLYSFIHSQEN